MKLFLYTLGFLLSLPQAYALTLEHALSLAQETNPEIQQLKSSVNIAQEGVVQAQGGFLPTVSATASLGNHTQKFDSATTFSDAKNHPRVAQLSIEQPLFMGGKMLYTLRDARNQLKAATSLRDLNTQNVLLRVVGAYMGLLREREVTFLQESQVVLLKESLKETQIRFENGDVTKTDIKQAEARLSQAVANYVNASGVFKTSETVLKSLLGELPQDLQWPDLLTGLPATVEDVKNEVKHNHPQIIAALAELTSKKYRVNVAKAAHYPTLTASASLSKNVDVSALFPGLSYHERLVSLNLSVPLFNGGKILSGVRKASAERTLAADIYEQTQRAIEQELNDSFYSYQATVAALDAYTQAEKATAVASKGVAREVQLGERQVLDGLNAQQELLEAQVNIATGKHNVVVASYRLLAAMGQLNLEHIQQYVAP